MSTPCRRTTGRTELAVTWSRRYWKACADDPGGLSEREEIRRRPTTRSTSIYHPLRVRFEQRARRRRIRLHAELGIGRERPVEERLCALAVARPVTGE